MDILKLNSDAELTNDELYKDRIKTLWWTVIIETSQCYKQTDWSINAWNIVRTQENDLGQPNLKSGMPLGC